MTSRKRAVPRIGPQSMRRARKRPEIKDFPEPIWNEWEDPPTFAEALDLHMRRHRDGTSRILSLDRCPPIGFPNYLRSLPIGAINLLSARKAANLVGISRSRPGGAAMGIHAIILIHGMGVYVKEDDAKKRVKSDAWFAAAEKSIVAAYEQYDTLKAKPFSENFQFVRVNYDAQLDKILVNTNEAAAKLKQLLPSTFLAKAADFLTSSGKLEDNFFWTHVLDCVLYTFVEDIRMAIKVGVADAIAKTLTDKKVTSWSVLAHSLGTVVANDTLSALNYELQVRGVGGAWPRANIVGMIANVSRALESEAYGPCYGDRMRPGPKAAAFTYLSAAHKLDPFTMVAPFNPEKIEPLWTATLDPYAYYRFHKVHDLMHYQPDVLAGEDGKLALADLIPHQFEHYFAHPRVHLSYFSAVVPWGGITGQMTEAAALKFSAANKKKLYDKLAARLEGVGTGAGEGIPQERERLKRVFEFIRYALQRLDN